MPTWGVQRTRDDGLENACKPRWLVPRGSGALNMGDERTAIEPEARRKAWLRRMADELLKLEPLFPMANFLPEEGLPLWVRKVEREVGAVMFPVARLKDELNLTPRRMGALIGHACAYGVWMMEIIGHELATGHPLILVTHARSPFPRRY